MSHARGDFAVLRQAHTLHPFFTFLLFSCSKIDCLQIQPYPSTTAREFDRRSLLKTAGATIASLSFFSDQAVAAETVGKDPNCSAANCLGVWDGLLADCPHDNLTLLGGGAGCTSSQDDTPGIFSEPWDYGDTSQLEWETQMKNLKVAIQFAAAKRGDIVTFVMDEGRYLRAQLENGGSGERSIGEFYFTPDDTTVQFRVAYVSTSRPLSFLARSQNTMDFCESIRKQAGYTKLPVLQNRKLSLFFGESEYDTFGPGSASLGSPAEMISGELVGKQDLDFCDNQGLNCLPFGIKRHKSF